MKSQLSNKTKIIVVEIPQEEIINSSPIFLEIIATKANIKVTAKNNDKKLKIKVENKRKIQS